MPEAAQAGGPSGTDPGCGIPGTCLKITVYSYEEMGLEVGLQTIEEGGRGKVLWGGGVL